MIGPNGGIAQTLVSSIERISFKFINGLDIDSSIGVIYFKDSSTTFQRRYADILSRSTVNSRRLLKYDLHTKNTFVIYRGLMFPNGVALNKNHSFLLMAETTQRRILKLNLGINNFEPEVFAELPRVPDNIKMNDK
ncbi:protein STRICTOSIDINE SYNTHASE-LIKE 10-like [Gossypium australe]|uniref:Protein STRICTOSIDINE SYNTHASE-LIKE 10-like n=1 Tax=Gossypium australe TaxID=47621 RepID=A0A5B6VER3_9ROSI|nr:protein STRICTOSIDINE SYNTHASE-LIKE 10-like [Gossypium australe]